jgi:hypothetical protein
MIFRTSITTRIEKAVEAKIKIVLIAMKDIMLLMTVIKLN